MNFVVSSPGKTILYGEHAVVYGIPAIAASVALHTYISVQELPSTQPPKVELDFPSVGLRVFWSLNDIHSALQAVKPELKTDIGSTDNISNELDPALHACVQKLVASVVPPEEQFKKAAAEAFLYLFMSINPQISSSLKFSTTSTLPIGAGLGSSASFSASLAAALLKVANLLSNSTSHEKAMELITKYSFLGECCIHGKPSGIDNVVATRGGAVYFKRSSTPGEAPLVKPYSDFPELQLILTDTQVPRLTSQLVAQVAQIKQKWPKIFEPLMAAFKQVVEEADALLSESPADPQFADKICELAELNHGLLSTISVSHPALEKVRDVSKELGIGTTKLTGAGGGGCAITVASKPEENGNAAPSIDRFKEMLGDQFRVFATSLGVKGVGYAPLDGATDVNNGAELSKLEWTYY